MSKQFHFVVYYDEKTEQFILDHDTTEIRFSGGIIYNEETESWEYDDEETEEIIGKIGYALGDGLRSIKL